MKVLLIDDSALFLDGLRSLLEAHGIEVLGTITNAREAISSVRQLHPEIVLMDIQMPQMSGIDVARQMHRHFPTLPIVMMTVSEDDRHLYDSIAAGARGYLLKSMGSASFIASLKGMARGETALSPGLAEKIMAEFARRDQSQSQVQEAAITLLTERQRTILRMVAAGESYRDIATELKLSEATIKYHMGEIVSRLHVENRTQAIVIASRYQESNGEI
jgi:two-component system NarL family response regulator